MTSGGGKGEMGKHESEGGSGGGLSDDTTDETATDTTDETATDTTDESATPEKSAHSGSVVATISQVLGSPRFWAMPVVLVVVVMSVMAALYMGAIADPSKNLHNFPVALVDADTGSEMPNADGTTSNVNYGKQVADGIVTSAAKSGIEVTRTDRNTAFQELNAGKTYGVVVIAANFSDSVVALGKAAVLTARPSPVTVAVYINRGSGTFASSITTSFADRVSGSVNDQMGSQLTDTVRGQLAALGAPFSGAAQLALSNPVDVPILEASPLPEGSGNGLSAFYFTILLVLAGFTGAMMVSVVVDAILGQTPIEYGPFYQLRVHLAISRWATLAAKWIIMALIAAIQSAMYLAVCTAVGTALPNAFTLWIFSTATIFAVGVAASSVLAVFGNPGLIVNLLFFVILGLPSSGGTVPLEASPRIFTWIAWVEPMHLVYLGVRAILYFDADWGAGLGRSVLQIAIGLVIGVLMGWLTTRLYDRRGWRRYPGGMVLSDKLARILDRTGTPTITTPSPHHVVGYAPPGTAATPSVTDAVTRDFPASDAGRSGDGDSAVADKVDASVLAGEHSSKDTGSGA